MGGTQLGRVGMSKSNIKPLDSQRLVLNLFTNGVSLFRCYDDTMLRSRLWSKLANLEKENRQSLGNNKLQPAAKAVNFKVLANMFALDEEAKPEMTSYNSTAARGRRGWHSSQAIELARYLPTVYQMHVGGGFSDDPRTYRRNNSVARPGSHLRHPCRFGAEPWRQPQLRPPYTPRHDS